MNEGELMNGILSDERERALYRLGEGFGAVWTDAMIGEQNRETQRTDI